MNIHNFEGLAHPPEYKILLPIKAELYREKIEIENKYKITIFKCICICKIPPIKAEISKK